MLLLIFDFFKKHVQYGPLHSVHPGSGVMQPRTSQIGQESHNHDGDVQYPQHVQYSQNLSRQTDVYQPNLQHQIRNNQEYVMQRQQLADVTKNPSRV